MTETARDLKPVASAAREHEGAPLGLEKNVQGDFVVDAAGMARRFGLPVATFREWMRLHLVSSKVEVGSADDAGTSRLTIHCGNRFWRAIIDDHDNVQSEEMGFTTSASRRIRDIPCKNQ